jgi:hypothetical protein
MKALNPINGIIKAARSPRIICNTPKITSPVPRSRNPGSDGTEVTTPAESGAGSGTESDGVVESGLNCGGSLVSTETSRKLGTS